MARADLPLVMSRSKHDWVKRYGRRFVTIEADGCEAGFTPRQCPRTQSHSPEMIQIIIPRRFSRAPLLS